MTSPYRRSLPARPDLAQQRKLAKDLLRDFRSGDREATARIRAELPDKSKISLTDAQFVLAREYGFASWRELKDHIARHDADQRPPIERFKHAVQRGDAKQLRALLEKDASVRASVNATIFAFDSPALVAASGGNKEVAHLRLEVVDVLLEFGADPNRKSDWWAGGFHPSYGASPGIADRLIAAGAVIDACSAAHLDRVELLAAMLAEHPERVHERGGDGQMPLHFARSRAVVDLLLASGADIDARDLDHRSTAAEWMIGDAERRDLATYLVERGASADIFLVAALGLTDRAAAMLEANPSLLARRTSQGEYAERRPSSYHIYQWTIGPNMTPLQVAAKFGQHDTVRAMEPFATPTQLLLLACHQADGDRARAIIAEHPGIVQGLGAPDSRALADEAWMTNAPAVELMMELGFDPAKPGGMSMTSGNALHCACWEGSTDCVSAILRRPSGLALLAVRDGTYGGTPLSWTAHGSINCHNPNADHPAVARLLIAAGAPLTPDMADWEGSDELMAVITDALAETR
jgi:hypothetical protein